MSNVLRTYPFIFTYKTIHFSVTESDSEFMFELTCKNMIHTSYTPQTIKGNKLTAKVNFGTSDRLGSKETGGVSMHITFNSDYNWFCSLVETETGITMEFHTGEHQFVIDHTLKGSDVKNTHQYVLSAHIPK